MTAQGQAPAAVGSGEQPASQPRGLVLRPWLGAVLISLSGVWVRLAAVEPARSALLRTAYALPALVVLVWLSRRRSHRAGIVPAARSAPWLVPLAVGAGLLFGLDIVTYHGAIELIGAGLGTLLPNLQVVVVGLAGVVLFRERPQPAFWVALPLVLAGVWLIAVVGRPVATGGSVAVGVALGVVAGVTYAGFLLVIRVARLRRPGTGTVEMLLSATLGAAVLLVAVAAWQGVAAPPASWTANAWLVVLAMGSQVAGWLLLTSSIHHLPATLTSVALLLQPVLAMVWGAILLGEPIGAPQVAGAAIVLTGVALAHRAVTRPAVPGPV